MTKKYYKKIKNKNYDRELLDIADVAVAGKGDGQISIDDAEKILWAVKDAGEYTDIEKRTIHYIRDNYKFTPKANKWFRTEIRSWAAKKSSIKKIKPIKAKSLPLEVNEELPLEPDPSFYNIQKPYQAQKKDLNNRNRFYLFLSVGILILFIFAYLFFSSFQKWFGKQKNEKVIILETDREINIDTKKSNTAFEDTITPEIKENNIRTTEKFNSIAGLTEEIISSESLIFDNSEIYVNKKNRAFLRNMAEFLKENKNLKIKVIGHTCSNGTDEDNQKLSVERAESVINYLKIRGVEPSRLLAAGEGEKKPIADNSKRDGKEKNRRVQFEVISN